MIAYRATLDVSWELAWFVSQLLVAERRVLGGSGSINGMLFVRGNRKNYDDWAAAGCAGWSFADVLPSFRRLEDWEDGASALRGGSRHRAR